MPEIRKMKNGYPYANISRTESLPIHLFTARSRKSIQMG